MRFSRLFSLISLTIFSALGLVIVSSWATRHAIGGGQRFSADVRKSVLALAEFPTQTKSLVGLLNNYLPPKGGSNIYLNYLESLPGSNRISGFVLVSYISSNGPSAVSLINLENRSHRVIDLPVDSDRISQYSDVLIGSEPRRQSAFSSRHRVWHPYLSKDGNLTYTIPWNDLISVDLKTGQERWRVRGAFHHSIETDANGDLWVCGAVEPESIPNHKPKTRHCTKFFEDHALVKVSRSGIILEVISVADLILTSRQENILYGASNPNFNIDPFHLNQITPILNDFGLFKKGQILVSLRNMSKILLVDPVAKLIIWQGSGDWMNQHSVFPTGQSKFSVLDNHSFASGEYWLNPSWRTRVVEYNIENNKSTEIEFNKLSPRSFYIPIEGRAIKITADEWLIEDSTAGTLMIFNNQKLIYKWSNIYADGTVGVVSWCRYLPESATPRFLLAN